MPSGAARNVLRAICAIVKGGEMARSRGLLDGVAHCGKRSAAVDNRRAA